MEGALKGFLRTSRRDGMSRSGGLHRERGSLDVSGVGR
jgi:hypothetical protein